MSRRYLLVKVVTDKAPTREEFQDSLFRTTTKFFGEVGFSKISPRVVRYDEKDWLAIVGARKEALDNLRASLVLVTEISGRPAAMLVLRSAGTIKSLTSKRRRRK